jgi:cyd operon protein YbgT
MFPFIMPSSTMMNASLTMWDATSSQLTLNLMTYVAIVFVPIILAYTSWCYWKMFGRITREDIERTPTRCTKVRSYMWYFAWILGTLLACAFGVITALALEHVEAPKRVKKNTDEYYRDALRDNGQAPVKGAFLIDGIAAGRLHLLGSVALCGKDQRAGNLAWLPADVGGLRGVIHGVGFRPRAVHWQGFFVRLSLIWCSLWSVFFFF